MGAQNCCGSKTNEELYKTNMLPRRPSSFGNSKGIIATPEFSSNMTPGDDPFKFQNEEIKQG